MTHIFNLGELDNFNERIDLDDLYETKRINDLSKLEIFNKLLGRIHNKIKITSRQRKNEQFCWFLVPEIMIGVPRYDQSACISFLMDKLNKNGFNTKYTHPNLILISWKHYIPSYVRYEIKKKTGINVDGYGNVINTQHTEKSNPTDLNELVFKTEKTENTDKTYKKEFKSIKDYSASGNLIYTKDILEKMQDKMY